MWHLSLQKKRLAIGGTDQNGTDTLGKHTREQQSSKHSRYKTSNENCICPDCLFYAPFHIDQSHPSRPPEKMVTAYWSVFSATLAIVISAFLKDRNVSKFSLNDWAFILIAALLWPITLPFIFSSKVKSVTSARRQKAKQVRALPTEADSSVFPAG